MIDFIAFILGFTGVFMLEKDFVKGIVMILVAVALEVLDKKFLRDK